MGTYVIDDFNDGVLDSYKINTFGEAGIVESGGKLRTPAGGGGGVTRPCYSNPLYDLTKGRLCVQLAKTGTTHVDVYTYFGIWDTASKVYSFFGRTTNADMPGGVDQLGASSTATNNDTTVGLGPSWTANTYLGVSYVESTRTLTFAKSSSPTGTWTTIRTVVVTTPAFAFRRAGLIMGMSNFASGSSSMECQWDNLTYVATDTALRVRVRFGGAWVYASPKVMVGGVWKRPITRMRNSANWNRSM